MEKINISDVLNYKNKNVIDRYEKDYINSKKNSSDVFNNLLNYLWLKNKLIQDKQKKPYNDKINLYPYVLYPQMKEMDDMWHTFLLFTKDYREFCQSFFGDFIDHEPNIEGIEIKDTQGIEAWLYYIGDNLGEKTLREWFS